jgi:hypothetical protein
MVTIAFGSYSHGYTLESIASFYTFLLHSFIKNHNKDKLVINQLIGYKRTFIQHPIINAFFSIHVFFSTLQ